MGHDHPPRSASHTKRRTGHAIVHNGVVYTTATHPLDPTSGDVIEGDVEAQTVSALPYTLDISVGLTGQRQVFRNLAAILDSAGSGLDLIIKNGVYITVSEPRPIRPYDLG